MMLQKLPYEVDSASFLCIHCGKTSCSQVGHDHHMPLAHMAPRMTGPQKADTRGPGAHWLEGEGQLFWRKHRGQWSIAESRDSLGMLGGPRSEWETSLDTNQ